MGGRAAGRALGRAALIGPIGLASSYPYTDDVAVVADEAQHVESLGFSTLWRSGNLPMIEAAVRATTSIPVATGIIPVDSVPAADVVATRGVWSPSRWDFSHRWADTAET